jgi:hypothetical protein
LSAAQEKAVSESCKKEEGVGSPFSLGTIKLQWYGRQAFFALVRHSAFRDGKILVIKKGPFSPFFYSFWQEQDGHFAFVLSSLCFAHVVSPGMGSVP